MVKFVSYLTDIEQSLETVACLIQHMHVKKMSDAKELTKWSTEVAKLRAKLLNRIEELQNPHGSEENHMICD